MNTNLQRDDRRLIVPYFHGPMYILKGSKALLFFLYEKDIDLCKKEESKQMKEGKKRKRRKRRKKKKVCSHHRRSYLLDSWLGLLAFCVLCA